MKILVDGRLWSHPKLIRFAREIGRTPTEAGGYLARLWSWTAEYRLDGSLVGLDPSEVCSAAGWSGKADRFVRAATSSGWLDGKPGSLQVHDWQEHQGKYIERILADRARKRRGTSTETPRSLRADSAPPVPSPVPSPSPMPLRAAESPPDEVQRHLFVLARKADLAAREDTLRRYLRSWTARAGAPRVEQVLMDPKTRGANVLQIDKSFFNGESKLHRPAETPRPGPRRDWSKEADPECPDCKGKAIITLASGGTELCSCCGRGKTGTA